MAAACHRFGRVEVLPVERQVLIEGEPATLGARAFDVLLALIERRERVVTKNELLDLVWPGLVVEENNLQVQISALRKLVGPSAIATIPGRGYRFAATLDAPSSDVPESTAIAPARSAASAPVQQLLIGREEDLAALRAAITQHRLVTVLGAAGVGKTSLARTAADAAGDGTRIVAWTELAPLSDPALIPAAIAQALQLPLASTDLQSALLAAIRPLEALLVLDNAEHLIEPLANLVPRLLVQAPGLRLLVTSQAPLKVDGEWLFRLAPLACPQAEDSFEQARERAAVALFAADAQAADLNFRVDRDNVGVVAGICRHLDGVPLAIKLAAARVPLLGLAGLHEALTHSLKVLGGGPRDAPARQQTLRAAFDWSYNLLTRPEQIVFRRLGVFVGGFTLQAACAVCGDERHDDIAVIDALGALVDRSFVAVGAGAQPRYHLLQTAREYALLQLERSGESAATSRRHALVMLALLQQTYDVYWQEPDDALYNVLACDLDNVRAAVNWSVANDATLAFRLTGEALMLFWTSGQLHESLVLTERIEPLLNEATPADAAAPFWRLRSLALQLVASERSAAAALKALALFRESGDVRQRVETLAEAIVTKSLPAATKEQLLLELREVIVPHWPADARAALLAAEAAVAWLRGDRSAAREAYLRAAALPRSRQWRALLLTWLVDTEHALGLLDDAVRHAREGLALLRERGPSNLLLGLQTLAGVLIERGDLGEARAVLVEAAAVSCRAGWWRLSDIARRFLCLASREARMADAARMIGYLRRLDISLDPLAEAAEVRLQSFGEAETSAALAPDELARYAAEGAMLDEAAICAVGLAAPEMVTGSSVGR
ncbi:MAG TPA: winged helix-turn-helix domain-containing protein [Burkholderiaceae bacterium]|nr:winged helix-turn-helix domain-containing protein [Burkholderiaceae bacterium]